MGIISGFTVYVCIWWVLWFMLLPWGVKPQENRILGTDPGAPERGHLIRKLCVTSALALVIWALVAWAISANLYSFDTPE
jgi:predicted secreted protein